MGAPDIVYVCRDGENEELRYSLRSLQNLPHGRVWVAGGAPSWLSGEVGRITVPQSQAKWSNSRLNLEAACRRPDVSERFLLFNDDMFIMQRVEETRIYHRGTINEFIRHYRRLGNGPYVNGMVTTAAILHDAGLSNLLAYELHVPMPMEKTKLLELGELGGERNPIARHTRTRYGNYWHLGGEQIDDVKVYDMTSIPSGPFLSTNDTTFRNGAIGRHIRATFTVPSPYET